MMCWSKSNYVSVSIVFIVLSTASLTHSASAKTSTRPHIILIVADDLGYNDVSFHGSYQIPTPNIDYLAYNGILLNNYYVQPLCTPTRSALLTGRHPIHTGMQSSVIVGSQPYGLPLNETLMSQHLNTLGYRSHIVGKWHLGMVSWDYTPLYRGFESHLGYYQGCEDYYEHTYEADLDQWGLDFRKDKTLLRNYTGKYSTDVFREEAINVIHNHNKSEPLFLYLPFQSVHSGNQHGAHLQAPDKYMKKFDYIKNLERRKYAGMLGSLDDAIGEIYDTLKKTDMLDNSIIVFTTDNGGPANGYDFNAANNFPLRGVKQTLWEGGVRAVGLVHSPLLKIKGYVANQMLHVCDWLPTLYSAAGGDVSELKNLDGVNAWEMLNTNGLNVRNEILHNIDPIYKAYSIRVGDYKLLFGKGVSTFYGKWYPPWQFSHDDEFLHSKNYSETIDKQVFVEQSLIRRQINEELYKSIWPSEVSKRLDDLYKSIDNNYYDDDHNNNNQDNMDLKFKSELITMKNENGNIIGTGRSNVLSHYGKANPVRIECGQKPANASTNCQPHTSFCLYNIPNDPCEYNNIAEQNPEIVELLVTRLIEWDKTMVKPGNKPFDDRGNPRFHQGAWVPWQ